jgi:hypothetical protein
MARPGHFDARRISLQDLPDQFPEGEDICTVTADGAHETRRRHTTIIDRQPNPSINDPQEGSAVEG